MRRLPSLLCLLTLCAPIVGSAEGPVFMTTCNQLAWDANTEPDLAGYKIYDNSILIRTVGIVTSLPCSTLAFGPGQHALQLTAFDTLQNEGPRSTPPVPFVILAQGPSVPTFTPSMTAYTWARTSAAQPILLTASMTPARIRIAGLGGNPAIVGEWPTGVNSDSYSADGTTFLLCLRCFPADEVYHVTLSAWFPGVTDPIVTTIALTFGTIAPPPPVPTRKGLVVTQPDQDHVTITWTEGAGKDCVTVRNTRSGTWPNKKITIVCTP